MKTSIFILISVFCITFLIDCEKVRDEYQIETVEVREIPDSGFIFTCNIRSNKISNISEFGLEWSTDSSFSVFERKSITTNIQIGNNSIYVNYNLYLGIKYFVKAFIKVNNSILYSKSVSLSGSSIPPLSIIKFLPEKGTWNDTISIYGTNFNNDINNISSVKINNLPSDIIFHSDTILKVIVPDNLLQTQSFISLLTTYDTIRSLKPFTLLSPKITDFTPKIGERGTELTITGNNFNPLKDYNTIKIGNYVLETKSAKKNQLSSIIPEEMITEGIYDLSVTCGGQTAISSVKYSHIEAWSKLTPGYGQVSLYHGTSITEVYFMVGTKCYTARFNFFERRLGYCSNYISVFDPVTNSSDNLVLWYLDYNQWDISIFVDNDKIFVKRSASISEVDTVTQKLIIKNAFPGNISSRSVAFTLNNTGYLYTGNNELWSYNSFNDIWIQRQNVPNSTLIRNMVIDNICYMLFKLQDNSYDFYTYDGLNSTWSLLNHYSSSDPMMSSLSGGSWLGYNSEGYCLVNYINGINQPVVFIFNPTSKIWSGRIGPYYTEGNGELQYGFNNFIYAINKNWISGDTYNYTLWKYDTNKKIPQ